MRRRDIIPPKLEWLLFFIQRDRMIRIRRTLLFTALLFATPFLHAQATESSIMSEMRSLATETTPQTPALVVKIASEIRPLPAGQNKVHIANGHAQLASRVDPGLPAFQAVADTLAQSLAEYPVSGTDDQPPMPYIDLAKLVHYEHVRVTLDDPLLAKAALLLVAEDADAERADFPL